MQFDAAPQVVAFCHCGDCRRWTGAPAPAFAAFDVHSMTATPPLPAPFSVVDGIERWNCVACGSPMLARFDYVSDQFYVPVGVLDDAEHLTPNMHCHAQHALPWVQFDDDLPRHAGSGRTSLRQPNP